MAIDPATEPRDARRLAVIARLREGVTIDQARAAMEALGRRLAEHYPETNRGWSVHVRSLHDAWLPPVTQIGSYAQQGLVGFVLLIVCANVANMMLAQAAARRREVAMRAALGAGRSRLIRQALTESTLLALVGGGFGILLTLWGCELILEISPVPIPYWLRADFNLSVLLFTLAISLATEVLIGLLPALRSTGRCLSAGLKAGARSAGEAGGWPRHLLRTTCRRSRSPSAGGGSLPRARSVRAATWPC